MTEVVSGPLPQAPVPPQADLRSMLRRHLVERALAHLSEAADRRAAAREGGDPRAYCGQVRAAVRRLYGRLPAGVGSEPVRPVRVSAYEKHGFRIENLLFESFPGWQVNATAYVPLDYAPPFLPVVVPVGHSGKQYSDYQLPCQVFARAGYLALSFDPPGQAGEKQPGNDHFRDGVRCYLVGQTSSRYFVADALRCLDYLETRGDVDMARGAAMTGVSGGGTTTLVAGLLDDRIAVVGPSCCVTPLADLDLRQCYAGCPETHMWRRYPDLLDEVDLLAAGLPRPALLMAGQADEVFRIEDTRQLAAEVAECYRAAGVPELFEWFEDTGGHGYSLVQAWSFVDFMDRWLAGRARRDLGDLRAAEAGMIPAEELRCGPRPDVNMRSLSLERAIELARERDAAPDVVRQAARRVVGLREGEFPGAPAVRSAQRFRVWTHWWQELLLAPEPGIELPATLITAASGPGPCLLWFDPSGRHALLARHGPLAQAIRFLEREARPMCLMAVDVRGWGDSAPALFPYEMAGWGSTDRHAAYVSAALGDPVLAMRARDGLAALAHLRERLADPEQRFAVGGAGLGGVVALHVAAADGRVQGVVVWGAPISFRSLLEADDCIWTADAFMPGALCHYDLPELARSLGLPVLALNPRNGQGRPLSEGELERSAAAYGTQARLAHAEWSVAVGWIQALLEGRAAR